MRKYLIGFIVGVVVSVSATAYADDIVSLIGQQVDGQTPVYLNGTKLDDAVIIDSKSYAPIRTVSEAAGLEVSYTEGEIQLSEPQSTETPAVDTQATTPEPSGGTVTEPVVSKEEQLSNINDKIGMIQSNIRYQEIILDPNNTFTDQRRIEAATKKEELESQLADLEAQKAVLEAQQ